MILYNDVPFPAYYVYENVLSSVCICICLISVNKFDALDLRAWRMQSICTPPVMFNSFNYVKHIINQLIRLLFFPAQERSAVWTVYIEGKIVAQKLVQQETVEETVVAVLVVERQRSRYCVGTMMY